MLTTATSHPTSRQSLQSGGGELHDWFDEASLLRPAKVHVVAAWLLLVAAGLVLKLGGFASLQYLVGRWPVRRGARIAGGSNAIALEARAALRRGCTYYFCQTWCLQKSAVLVCFLRAHGVPAQVVIGVQKLPFRAHAWVEADGLVINGPATLKSRLTVIERW